MIKVINLGLYDGSWKESIINDITYFESPVINQFINDGWSIKDWKLSGKECIFIFEK